MLKKGCRQKLFNASCLWVQGRRDTALLAGFLVSGQLLRLVGETLLLLAFVRKGPTVGRVRSPAALASGKKVTRGN